MKKSEALKFIIENLPYKELHPEDYDIKILEVIEKLGMLPPTIRVSEDMYIRSTGEYGYDINEWESENE